MPPDDKRPTFKGKTVQLIGTGPRKTSPKVWDSSKPPGGELPAPTEGPEKQQRNATEVLYD